MSSNIPTLRGKDGVYRIVIHGNSGTGKTTLSKQLSELLDVPVIHLDEVHWRPGWVAATDQEIIEELTLQIDKAAQAGTGWVVDGNYERPTKRMMDFEATDIIWLDPPFYKYFPRTLLRTFRRLLGVQETCAPGCKESWRECFLSSNSIILYCITNHFKSKRRYRERWMDDNVVDGGRWRRLGDVDEHAAFLDAVSKRVKTS